MTEKHDALQSPTGYDAAQTDFLDLFVLQRQTKWTRAVALYDALPKYLFSAVKKHQSVDANEAIKTSFTYAGKAWKFTLEPAKVTGGKGGKGFFAYPGEREELVARALRYLAVQGDVPVSWWTDEKRKQGPQARLAFTLYQLHQILAHWGHTFSTDQIDEALKILLKTSLTVHAEGNEASAEFSGTLILEYFAMNQKGEGPSSKKRVVVLNTLEVQAIQEGQYRAVNFDRMMSLESPLARRIYEYVMTHHLGADKPPLDNTGKPPRAFELKLSTVIRECCIQAQDQLRHTIKRVRNAIDELKEQGVLWEKLPYEEFLERERTKGRARIADVTWRLYLSRDAVADIIAANSEAWPQGENAAKLNLPAPALKKLRKEAAQKHL